MSFKLGVAHPTFHGKMAICSLCDHLFILSCLGKLDRHKTWSRNSWTLQCVLCFHLNLLVARGCTFDVDHKLSIWAEFLQRRKSRCKLPCFLAVISFTIVWRISSYLFARPDQYSSTLAFFSLGKKPWQVLWGTEAGEIVPKLLEGLEGLGCLKMRPK